MEALPRWLLHDTTSNTLRELLIADCPNIRALPEIGLQKLTHLQKLEIEDCPKLTERCRAKRGKVGKESLIYLKYMLQRKDFIYLGKRGILNSSIFSSLFYQALVIPIHPVLAIT